MDWIKKRYDQFALVLFGALLLAFAVLIFLKTQSYGQKFTGVVDTVPQNKTIPPLVLDRIVDAKAKFEKSAKWTVEKDTKAKTRGSLFVANSYIVGKEGIPVKPIEGVALNKDSLTGQDIPNKWFDDHGLPLLDPTVALQDPDKDGFANEDEQRAGTDPNKKESHPPYHTKLFLKQFIQIPFRLIFKSYDGDAKKDKIEKMSFQIDTVDLHQPTEFLKINEMVPKTKFKIIKFEYKTVYNPQIQEQVDASELTVQNIETNEEIVLILDKIINSPNTFALFDYQWPQPPLDIRVAKLGEFVLKPLVDKRYKLVDINENEAVIQTPDGEKYIVRRDPRKGSK